MGSAKWAAATRHSNVLYIDRFDAATVRSNINELDYCARLNLAVPVLFFAVEYGSLDIIRILVKAGADVEARTFQWQIPILAYVVLLSDVDKKDTTEVFKLLLALSANPKQIP